MSITKVTFTIADKCSLYSTLVKRSFIVRLHRGLSNSKEIVLACTECWVVEKVKLQPQEQAKSQDH